ncbi:MAG: hypothetical protein ACR2FI_09950 [Burkholderiales bacterium]|nr:hypothetical protein [Pseudomonadota bacterium]
MPEAFGWIAGKSWSRLLDEKADELAHEIADEARGAGVLVTVISIEVRIDDAGTSRLSTMARPESVKSMKRIQHAFY